MTFRSWFDPSFFCFSHRTADKVRKIADVTFDGCCDVLKSNDSEFNVLNHADSCIVNVMFRYDENKKPIQHIFVSIYMKSKQNVFKGKLL